MSFVSHHWLPLLVCMGWVADILLMRRRCNGPSRRGGYLGRSASTGMSRWTGDVPGSIGAGTPPRTSEGSSSSFRLGDLWAAENAPRMLHLPSRPSGPTGFGGVTAGRGGSGEPPGSAGYGDAA